ncbi:MAG: putative DNA binding domain-containing protein [Chitinophagales bacterium]|nr:putative DNA binding domain-containing protein [Chitinophagales bacterium]
MNAEEILDIIAKGETSSVQFKANVHNEQSIAQEMVAFANTKGSKILIGVDDKTWDITGLTADDLRRLTNLLVNAADQYVKEPIFINTETVGVKGKLVLVVTVPEGIAKPYKDKDGIIYLKNGANKRKVTSNEEISRLLQSSGYMYAEEKVIGHSSMADLDADKFRRFYEAQYKETPDNNQLEKHLTNLRLGAEGKLNIAGALLFGKNLQGLTPQFFITAIWFWGNEITDTKYRSSENIYGTLDELYRKGFDFVLSKLHKIQQPGKSFNSLGVSEVPEIVITELLINALIHRDYFMNDSIKLYVFENRIEIISPGRLPNNLTEAQVKKGIRRTRNNIIASFAPFLMEYRGAGSGILRSLDIYPNFDINNEIENERVVVTIKRPVLK